MKLHTGIQLFFVPSTCCSRTACQNDLDFDRKPLINTARSLAVFQSRPKEQSAFVANASHDELLPRHNIDSRAALNSLPGISKLGTCDGVNRSEKSGSVTQTNIAFFILLYEDNECRLRRRQSWGKEGLRSDVVGRRPRHSLSTKLS